ncbi:MAG: hypothetical protein HAW61_05915, partial [Candidatus Portiera sp.]|nr:hypothetical protein [Portiera sp.]
IEKIEYYFHHKKLSKKVIDDGLAIAIVPLADEYLNTPNKPLWYLAPVGKIIHRLDLYVCDEAENCQQYIARFKVNVLADGPIIAALSVPSTSKNILRDITYFKTASHNSPIVTRVFEISNPTGYPVFFTLANEQPRTNIKILRRRYKRINAYYRRRQTTSYIDRTQVYSGGSSSNNRYRCNYTTSYNNVASTKEVFSDDFLSTTGSIHTSEEVKHYGSCSSGGSRTYSVVAAGYPKNVDTNYKSTITLTAAGATEHKMNFHSALDENNTPYHPDSYYLLNPGSSKRIRIQETLPRYSTYRDNTLPVLDNYSDRRGYNWKAASYLDHKLNIKFGRSDSSGLLEESSIIEFSNPSNSNTLITTSNRFTILPRTPE